MSNYTQCLILVESQSSPKNAKRTRSPPPLKKYALLPAKSVNHPFCKVLSQNGIQLIQNGQASPPESRKFKVLNIFLDDALPVARITLYVYLPVKNIAQQLFEKSDDIIQVLQASRFSLLHPMYATEEDENLKALEKFLIDNVEMTPFDTDAGSFLHVAVLRDHCLTKLLLKYGADANAVRRIDGATPLHVAVLSNSLTIVNTLVENGARLDVRKLDGSTPLHEAVKISSLSLIKYLLGRGAEIDVKLADGSTVLHQALRRKSLAIAQLLIENNADVTARTVDEVTALHIATGLGSEFVSLIELLLQKKADIHAVDAKGNTPVHFAVKKATDVLRCLVTHGADINVQNKDGATVLLTAVTKDWTETCDYLLSLRPDVDVAGNRKAFVKALCKGGDKFKVLVECMIRLGFRVMAEDVDEPGVLFGAIHKRHVEIVRRLLQLGANVQEYRCFLSLNLTPLHYACRTNQADIVLVLLEYGADVTAKRGARRHQRSPITDAAECASMEVMNMLVVKGARVRDEPLLLHLAVENPCSEVLQFLLNEGFDWNVSFKGETPLSVAIKRANLRAVEIMVNFGARVDFSCLPTRSGRLFGDSAVLENFLKFCFARPNLAGEAVICQLFSYSYGYGSVNESCMVTLARHLMKLEAVDETFSARSLIPSRVCDVFYECLWKEIAAMRSKKIGSTDVTVYDVLTKNVNQIVCFARNPDFRQFWELCDVENNYPVYGSILCFNARMGCLRRQLVDAGVKIVGQYSRCFFNLPQDLKEIVIGYLNNQELFVLRKFHVDSRDLKEVVADVLNNLDDFVLNGLDDFVLPKLPSDM